MSKKEGRNIVICCDGTGNQYGQNNTNVAKLFEMLVYDDNQRIFYDPGVGTASRSLFVPFQFVSNLVTQALGTDLQENVEEAYYYLMNNYQEGDKIFLFGFSRGAHTVRRLSTLLEMCGLLYRGSENMISYVSRMYLSKKGKRKDYRNDKVLRGFRDAFTRRCPVHFVGVWDTVSALSSLMPRPKLDGVLSKEQSFGYHAISIDEKRLQFPPSLWNEKDVQKDQVVEQVWFAGVHSDVGGWYNERGLSNTALKWMASNAISAGLRLKPGAIEGIRENPLDKIHESWTGHWWIVPAHLYAVLVGLFFYVIYPAGTAALLKESWLVTVLFLVALIPSTQKKRIIPKGSKIHESVRFRMNAKELKYSPKKLNEVIDQVSWVR